MERERRDLLMAAALNTVLGLLPRAAHSQGTIDAQAMFERLAREGKGFDMQPSLGLREAVYVVFDPRCRYCLRLREAARPVSKQIRLVWMPVALLNGKSEPQDSAILSAADSVAAMEAHSQSYPSGGRQHEDRRRRARRWWRTDAPIAARAAPRYRRPCSGTGVPASIRPSPAPWTATR